MILASSCNILDDIWDFLVRRNVRLFGATSTCEASPSRPSPPESSDCGCGRALTSQKSSIGLNW